MEEQNRRLQPAKPMAPPGLNWAFLQRTVVSSIVTASIVALSVAVYVSMQVGARYLFFALWSLFFFSTTGLIFKFLLFNESRVKGLLAVAAKIGALAAMMAAFYAWPIEGPHQRAHMYAMLAGLFTPLTVLVLRVIGWAMDHNGKSGSSTARTSTGSAPGSDRSSSTRFQMQS